MSRRHPGLRSVLAGLACASAAVSAPAVTASASAKTAKPHVCSGTNRSPGRLAGTYRAGVIVKGTCKVDAGPVQVRGSLTLSSRSILLADYALNHITHQGGSSLLVNGSVQIGRKATLILGCEYESACRDNSSGSLSSSDRVTGDVIASQPMSVVIHKTVINGSVRQTGGGGGFACDYHNAYFKLIKSPIFSNYEDSTIGGSVSVTNIVSCWLGFARLHVARNVTITGNRLSDRDAIEVLSNQVQGNLTCSGNTHTWDSSEDTAGNTGGLYPRKPEPNTVGGTRSGQCLLATPATNGGPPGPGPF